MPGLEDVDIEIVRHPTRRTVSISAHPPNKVGVSAPRSLPLRSIETLVLKRKRWIRKRIDFFEMAGELALPKKFIAGETYLYMGKVLRLEITEAGRRVLPAAFGDGVIRAFIPSMDPVAADQKSTDREGCEPLGTIQVSRNPSRRAEHVKNSIAAGYKAAAESHLGKRLWYWEQKTGLFATSLSVRSNRTRWGSCGHKGAISINWKVMGAEREVIDYLIVHELCHLRYKGHGPRFWGLVKRHIDDIKGARQRLSEISYLMEF